MVANSTFCYLLAMTMAMANRQLVIPVWPTGGQYDPKRIGSAIFPLPALSSANRDGNMAK
jgi:hypothetical protein